MTTPSNTTTISVKGQLAVEAAMAGLSIIPGNATGDTKRPLVRWQNGDDGPVANTDRAAYAAQVEDWWRRYPDADLFLITGSRSNNVCVLDLDEHPDRGISGLDTLQEWEAKHGLLFDGETVTAITGSGGYHLYFIDVRGGLRGYAQPAGSFLGVDVRAENQIAVMPPSDHKSGRRYEWENDPHEYDILPASDNLYDFIEFCRPSSGMGSGGDGSPKAFFDLPDEIPQGSRDETIYRFACSMQGKGLPDDYILERCIAANRLRCKPPLSDSEVQQKVASALTKPKGHDHAASGGSGGNGGSPGCGGGSQTPASASAPTPSEPEPPEWVYKYDKDGNIVGIHHDRVGEYLMEGEYGACRIGGSPHLFDFECGFYKAGWAGFNRAIIGIYPPVTKKARGEVTSWLDVQLPKQEREAPESIPFTNGVLRIDRLMAGGDDCMETYDPSKYITHQIPHRYNPDAECPQVDEFLDSVSCGDAEIKTNIVEAFGLALYPARNVIQEVPDFIGHSAGNGKTTTLDALTRVVGEENCCHMLPKDLSHDHKARALDGKLVCIMDDIPLDHWDSATASAMKNAITGGTVYTNVKYQDPYEFANIALIVMAANGYPSFSGRETDAIMRRLHPIEMKANYRDDNPDRDTHMLEKITTEEACEYWIRIAVEALMGVIERGGFSPSAASDRMRGEIRASNDTVMAWAIDTGTAASDIIDKPTSHAYALYDGWCDTSGLKPLGKIEFVKRANAHFGTKSVSKWMPSMGKNMKCFVDSDGN